MKSMPSDAYYADLEVARDAWHRRSMFNIVDFASGRKVDLILRKNRPFSRMEFDRRVQTTLLDATVFIASAEDTSVANSNGRSSPAACSLAATLALGGVTCPSR